MGEMSKTATVIILLSLLMAYFSLTQFFMLIFILLPPSL